MSSSISVKKFPGTLHCCPTAKNIIFKVDSFSTREDDACSSFPKNGENGFLGRGEEGINLN